MEEVDMDPEKASEPENVEVKSRVFTLEDDKDPGVELSGEMSEKRLQEREKQISPRRITNLQRHLTTLVTNIQTAADARESMRRKELEEARKMRLELLENDMKSSQEKFEEITRGWSLTKEKVSAQELQEALNNQQLLLTSLLEDKKKVIDELQQELKLGDDHFVKDLKKQAEERDLMLERMEDQIKTLTKAYREELAQTQSVNQRETKDLLTNDTSDWEQRMKKLWDTEQARLAQRRKTVEEYEAKIHSLIFETMDKQTATKIEQNAKLQVLEREHQKTLASIIVVRLNQIKEKHELEVLTSSRVDSLQTEKKNAVAKPNNQPRKTSQSLSKDYKQSVQQYERLQKKLKQIVVADARTFEEMWATVEAEVRQLAERALEIDSLICRQHFGVAWERPPMPLAASSSSFHTERQTHRPARRAVSQLYHTEQSLQRSSQRTTMGVDAETESADVDHASMGGTATQSEGDAELEDGTLTLETVTKVMELLWEEVGFLMEDDPTLLASLEKEEQTAIKLGSLLFSFGIEEEDLPKLAHFLLKYRQQQSEQTERVCDETGESSDQAAAFDPTSDLIHPNHVLPALKSFLNQYMKSRQNSCQSSVVHTEGRGSSEDKAYWESLGNVIPDSKVQLWEEAEKTLTQYIVILTDICALDTETDSLRQQNAELRMLLQQSLNPQVCHVTHQ
uniref:dynein regulatory complex protein 1-like isoform X1 n=1 Tax=Solea senegalensis TaxID=28829 RepID=UPI001CD888B0|nr:dynein regulatory complex protein 1-like isoform X1 [Solea senegalensis]